MNLFIYLKRTILVSLFFLSFVLFPINASAETDCFFDMSNLPHEWPTDHWEILSAYFENNKGNNDSLILEFYEIFQEFMESYNQMCAKRYLENGSWRYFSYEDYKY